MKSISKSLSLWRPGFRESRSCSLFSARAGGMILAAAILSAVSAVHAAAPTKYTVKSLLKRNDKVGETPIRAQFGFEVDSLNDNGQLLFVAYQASTETLFQYSGGKFTPIVGPGVPAPLPSGRWPNGDIWSPASMNQNGNAVFAMFNYDANTWLGTFQWDAKAGKTTAVALKGMPAVNDLTFRQAGFLRPAINSSDDLAFPAEVQDPTGKVLGIGLFFRGRDGKIQPVVLPQQEGPDGVVLDNGFMASISDQGRIAFLARRSGQLRASAYVWELGQLTPVAVVGTDVPGAGKIIDVLQTWVNNKNSDVLVEVALNDLDTGPLALLRYSNRKLSPAVVPGQKMPDGGQFSTLLYPLSVSFPNEAGQHAFYSLVNDSGVNRTAAYLLNADGSLSLILKGGDTTELGPIARVGDPDEGPDGSGFGIGLNSKGQVAMILKPVGAPQTLALLTPTGQ